MGSRRDRKLFAKLGFLCSRPIRGEGYRSNPYYPATRTIIIVKKRSLLSDNNHANVCLRYVPNDASR